MSDVHTKAVVDGKLMRVSVSQLQTADSCLRKWFIDKVLGVPRRQKSVGIDRGKQGHKRIEHYLKTGEDVLGPLERKGMAYFPTRGPDLGVELEFGVGEVMALDVPLTGAIDLVNPRGLPVLHLTDWKFKSSIEKWGVAEEDLVNPRHEAGIQMLGYAVWGMRKFPDAKSIKLTHVTFQTQGVPCAEPVSAEIPVDEVPALWDTVSRRIVPGMHEAATRESLFDVPCNKGACEKYNGCEYKSLCWSKGAQIFAGIKGATMGIGSAYKPSKVSRVVIEDAVEAAVQVPVQAPPPPPPVIAEPPPPPPKPPAQAATVPFCKTCGVKLTYENSSTNAQGPVHIGCSGKAPLPIVLPPDAPKSEPKSMLKNEVLVAPAVTAEPIVAPPVTPPTPRAAAPSQPAPETRPPPRRGRPPKDPGAPPPPPPEKRPVSPGTFLYWKCSPMGVVTQSLQDYVVGLEGRIAEIAQRPVDDLRGDTSTEFGFGKWKAYLAAVARENPPPAGHYIVDSDERSEVVAVALSSLLPPGHVVRG